MTGATGAVILWGPSASIREHHRSGKALINLDVGSGLPLDQTSESQRGQRTDPRDAFQPLSPRRVNQRRDAAAMFKRKTR